MASEALRQKGNELFKGKQFQAAQELYSQALSDRHLTGEGRSVVLSNRAACWIKLDKYKECEEDCAAALQLSPSMVKAMYRMAVAQEKLNKLEDCMKTLKILLQIEPQNREALDLMRGVRGGVIKKEASETGVSKILHSICWDNPKTVVTALQALIESCKDDVHQSMEFVRKGGFETIDRAVQEFRGAPDSDVVLYATRLLAVLTNHSALVDKAVDLEGGQPSSSSFCHSWLSSRNSAKLSVVQLCSFMADMVQQDLLIRSALVTLMNVLKATPASSDMDILPVESSAEVVPDLTISSTTMRAALCAVRTVLLAERLDTYVFACDTFSALISDLPNFYEPEKELDLRSESVSQRKLRLHRNRIYAARSGAFVATALELDLLSLFARHVASDKFHVRSHAVTCVGQLLKLMGDENRAKQLLKPLLPHAEEFRAMAEEGKSSMEMSVSLAPFVEPSRQRAALEAALLVTHPDLGAWALQEEGGTAQILLLIATQDPRCVEIAAEVLCLAAGVQSASDLLASLMQGDVIHGLLRSTVPGVRAAAASVLTKLSLKAKALGQGSEEVGQILNAVTSVLKASVETQRAQAKAAQAAVPRGALVSFSHHDLTAQHQHHDATSAPSALVAVQGGQQASSVAAAVSSLERAVEVVAAIVGQTFVKEEIVHGSSRVASLVAELSALEVDARSSAAYGLAHIFAALTVTNRELKMLALKDKEITLEQYEKMQELQRIKAEQEDGTVIEERREDPDSDTSELCKLRIRHIVARGGLRALLRLADQGSSRTKETACRALRQVCVDEMSRGLFVQQGGLKQCCSVAADADNTMSMRLEAAHAVAKALVTTNPNVLSEHLRLTSLRPLLLLCRETAASQLQQFEALLSLTNLLSCGHVEQDKFVAEKGLGAVHYLMFSDNLMVRRAATEALCNLSTHEALLALLRDAEKLKLWLALTEDWHPDPEQCAHSDEADRKEAFATARAAAGTLAMAANDEEVARAAMEQDVARSLCALLATEHPELLHRALVLLQALLDAGVAGMGIALLQGGVVPAMSAAARAGNPQLTELARACATGLSAALAAAPAESEAQA